ncbi:MAG: hypothetical protein MZU79_02250 [Anaerotruncus sp.]|nr:hypothetical protein [Anaerotruncus sp.]
MDGGALSVTNGTFTGGTTSDMSFTGSGNITLPTVTNGLDDITFDRTGNSLILGVDISIDGALYIPNGDLDINGKTLTFTGVSSFSGLLKGSTSSNIIINGTGTWGDMNFAAGAQTLGNLTINRTNTGIIGLASDLTIDNGSGTGVFNLVVGQFTINAGSTLSIQDKLLFDGGSIVTTGTLVFLNGSTYEHSVGGGVIPTATWNSGSTCLITGVTATAPSGLGQNFHHFTWNCPGQYQSESTLGALVNIAGNFTVENTGATTHFDS